MKYYILVVIIILVGGVNTAFAEDIFTKELKSQTKSHAYDAIYNAFRDNGEKSENKACGIDENSHSCKMSKLGNNTLALGFIGVSILSFLGIIVYIFKR